MNTWYHAGDQGDIIASLPAIRQRGGGQLVIGPGFCRESMKGARFDAIRELLLAQPYITGVEWSDAGPNGFIDLSRFREPYVMHRSLAHAQAAHLGVEHLDTSPWLKVPKNQARIGRVVFARSRRYWNGFFPWFALLKRHPDALFVGLPSEHTAFCEEFRCKLEYVPTANLLELAGVLAAARLFCGNQSCPWWIAFGLGTPTFQETWLHDRNSQIERRNAHYMTEPLFDLELLPK